MMHCPVCLNCEARSDAHDRIAEAEAHVNKAVAALMDAEAMQGVVGATAIGRTRDLLEALTDDDMQLAWRPVGNGSVGGTTSTLRRLRTTVLADDTRSHEVCEAHKVKEVAF